MRVSARVDYAVRALVVLAATDGVAPVTAEAIARAQGIPVAFLLSILRDLRADGLVLSQRGASGGYRLAREPGAITVADVFRALEGPLANVQDARPEDVHYPPPAEPLRDVWVAVRASLRDVLEHVTVGDVARGVLPPAVTRRTAAPDTWVAR